MTTLNKLVIYSSTMFFFSCIDGMIEKSSDDFPHTSNKWCTRGKVPLNNRSQAESRQIRGNISLGDLRTKRGSMPINRTSGVNYLAKSDDSCRLNFDENDHLSLLEQHNNVLQNNFGGIVRSNSVDNFELLEKGFYEASTAVNSRENLSSQFDITKSSQNLLANPGKRDRITISASQKNFFTNDKFVSSKKIKISKTTSMADFNSFEREQNRLNEKNRINFQHTCNESSPLIQEMEKYIPKPMPKNTKVIVSIDGGGVRGIIPLTFLLAVQKEIKAPLVDFVDTFIGVSVGALVATSAVIQKMDYVSDNFCEIDKEIFIRNIWSKLSLGFRGAWYSSEGKEKIFKNLLTDVDVSNFKSRLLVPAYSNNTNEPIMFDSRDPVVDLFDILMGTSAASTYFEPHICKTTNGKTLQLIDPGMNKNSPALLAYKMMRAEYAYDRIILLSVGTGADRKVKSISEYPHWLPSFAWEFPNIVMDSAVRWDEWTMKYIEKMDPSLTYERFQIGLDKCITDSVDPMYIDTLKNATLAAIHGPVGLEYERFNKLIELLSDVIKERKNI